MFFFSHHDRHHDRQTEAHGNREMSVSQRWGRCHAAYEDHYSGSEHFGEGRTDVGPYAPRNTLK